MIARPPDPFDDEPLPANLRVILLTTRGGRVTTWSELMAERAERADRARRQAAPIPPKREPTIRQRTHGPDPLTVKRRIEEQIRAELAEAPPDDEATVQVEFQRRVNLQARIMDESVKRSSTTTSRRKRRG